MLTVPHIQDEGWERLLRNDPEALSVLYREHYLGLINYGFRLTGDRDISNDCIVQVFIELWEKRLSLPAVHNVRAYLITCLHRKILLELKLNRRRLVREAEGLDELPEWEDSYEELLLGQQMEEEWKQKLSRALARLTKRQVELLRLRFYENESYDAIAVKCGITKRTAYNIVHDALTILRETLEADMRNRGDAAAGIPVALLVLVLSHYFLS